MTQIEKVKHFKKYQEETDYVEVYDRSLNNKKTIPIKDIDINGEQLHKVLDRQNRTIDNVLKDFNNLEKEFKELKELTKEIVRGLNSRWKIKY